MRERDLSPAEESDLIARLRELADKFGLVNTAICLDIVSDELAKEVLQPCVRP